MLLGQQAGNAGRRTSSRLLARNSPDWLHIIASGKVVWMDKRRTRVCFAPQHCRSAQPWRQIEARLRRSSDQRWSDMALAHCNALGIAWDEQLARGLDALSEPAELVCDEYDAYGRMLWLRADAQSAWARMRSAARQDGVPLCAISGWRSIHYQARLITGKLQRGQTLTRILEVSAAPGFSEHHAGTALDLANPGDLALEERFEATAGFAWLCDNAAVFGFVMSLPRGNRYGYSYEPWHWRLR